MNKKEMRLQMREKLSGLTLDRYQELSYNIKKRLLNELSIQKSKMIAITISKQPEVDTYEIIEALWQLGKQVVVPKCDPKMRTMDFYLLTSFSQLETVYMDLKEPIPSKTTYVSPEEIDVLIVPGIVYDEKGYRIGYGGGYYDRYLTQFEGMLISLAFHFQLVDEVPKEQHDKPVDLIITDDSRINCAKNRKER